MGPPTGAAVSEAPDHSSAALDRALGPLPTVDGGIVVVLATAGAPPAMAMLSSGDVCVIGTTVRVALHGSSSAGRHLGGAFTLLVPAPGRALRAEVVEATARTAGRLLLLEGRLDAIRPTAEPPWTFGMSFGPTGSGDVQRFVTYWRDVRAWLADPVQPPPHLP